MKKVSLALIVSGLLGVGLSRFLVLHSTLGFLPSVACAFVAALVAAALVSDKVTAACVTCNVIAVQALSFLVLAAHGDTGLFLLTFAAPAVFAAITAWRVKSSWWVTNLSFFVQTVAVMAGSFGVGKAPVLSALAGTAVIGILGLVGSGDASQHPKDNPRQAA